MPDAFATGVQILDTIEELPITCVKASNNPIGVPPLPPTIVTMLLWGLGTEVQLVTLGLFIVVHVVVIDSSRVIVMVSEKWAVGIAERGY